MSLYDDRDTELPVKILHNCVWFNPADNDDPFIESNFLYYEFAADPENVIVLVNLDDPLAAQIICPEYGEQELSGEVRDYLRKRFDRVEQSNGSGSIALWLTRN